MLGYLRARGAREPEDLTGEVFLQIVRDLSRFEGGERDFRAWVFVIAHHRLIDDRRQRARRPVEPADELPQAKLRSPDAESEALDSVVADRVQQVIGRLSPEQRDVLLLRVMGDLAVTEVAKAIGKSQGAVKALQRRGLAAIERALAREGVTP